MPSAGLGGVGPQAAGVQHGFMCDGGGSPTKVAAILPRPAEGTAVDPIALEAVDEVVITTLVDNSYDALMGDIGPARRTPFPAVASIPAPQFEEGRTYPGLIAEHGFSALVTTRRSLFELNSPGLLWLWHPSLADLRMDPRFKAVLTDLGLIDYYRATGHWADCVRPIGDDDFEVFA